MQLTLEAELKRKGKKNIIKCQNNKCTVTDTRHISEKRWK